MPIVDSLSSWAMFDRNGTTFQKLGAAEAPAPLSETQVGIRSGSTLTATGRQRHRLGPDRAIAETP